jgi:hypothetical protein
MPDTYLALFLLAFVFFFLFFLAFATDTFFAGLLAAFFLTVSLPFSFWRPSLCQQRPWLRQSLS